MVMFDFSYVANVWFFKFGEINIAIQESYMQKLIFFICVLTFMFKNMKEPKNGWRCRWEPIKWMKMIAWTKGVKIIYIIPKHGYYSPTYKNVENDVSLTLVMEWEVVKEVRQILHNHMGSSCHTPTLSRRFKFPGN